MAEYINREYLLDAMQAERERLRPLHDNYALGFEKGILLVKGFPYADVAPVVHGRWDSIPNTYMCVAGKDGSYQGCATSCSVCHEINPNAYKTNYCPNCGAKMDL